MQSFTFDETCSFTSTESFSAASIVKPSNVPFVPALALPFAAVGTYS